MKKRSILMNAWSVQRILPGEKSQTRRVIKHAGNSWHYKKLLCEWGLSDIPKQWDGKEKLWQWLGNDPPQKNDWIWELQTEVDDSAVFPVKCPYGKPGDLLWVRETWKPTETQLSIGPHKTYVRYRADDSRRMIDHDLHGSSNDNWKPSIYMPRWASRITLRIKDIRVERVQDISDEDCEAEGLFNSSGVHLWHCTGQTFHPDQPCRCGEKSPPEEFAELWDSINAKRGYSWEINPWIFAISFERTD